MPHHRLCPRDESRHAIAVRHGLGSLMADGTAIEAGQVQCCTYFASTSIGHANGNDVGLHLIIALKSPADVLGALAGLDKSAECPSDLLGSHATLLPRLLGWPAASGPPSPRESHGLYGRRPWPALELGRP